MARSEVNYIYEADTAFRAPGLAALAASGEVGTYALDKLVNAREGEQKNKLGAEGYVIVLAVEAAADAGADEVYTFDVEVQATGGGSAVTAATFSVPRGVTGQYVIGLDAHTLEKLSSDHEELALNLTVAGVAPAITFAAWVAPSRNR